VIRGTGIVSALTLVSRLLGFIRDLLVARLFGAGFYADAFFVAFRLPNLLRSFVAEGALSSAFVPVFSGELAAGEARARAAVRSVSALILALTLVLSIAGIIFAPQIVDLFAPGFDEDKRALCIVLTRVMLPFIICVSFVAMLNGALNALRIFGASAWAQVWMNGILITGAIAAGWYDARGAALCLAWSVVVGGVVQVLVQLPAMRRAGLSILPTGGLRTAVNGEIVRLMAPAIVGATVYQLTIFLNTILASLLEEGSVSWLFYADRLTQLPVGIFSIALASVLLPTLARARAEGNHGEFSGSLINSLRYTSFLIIPTAALIFIFAEPLIALMFERGAFTPYATGRTALAAQALALGLWSVSCHSMLVRAFLARKDTRTPTLIGIATLVLTLCFSLLFMGPVRVFDGALAASISTLSGVVQQCPLALDLGHAGLGLAASLASLGTMLLTAATLSRRLPDLEWRPFIRASIQAILASGVMVGALLSGAAYLPPGASYLTKLLIGLPAGAIIYLLSAWVLKSTEWQETVGLIRRFLVRR